MKTVPIVLVGLIFASCGSFSTHITAPTSTQAQPVQPKALYLVLAQGQLAADDLKAHPEVVVVHSAQELRELGRREVALWIDRDAIGLVDQAWLHAAPQKYYPVVLVGYNDALYSFREKLGGFGIIGPYVDWNARRLEPGFSVWKLKEQTSASTSAFMQGYDGAPTVEAILAKTNGLLEGQHVRDAETFILR